jgi:hypothetical protein
MRFFICGIVVSMACCCGVGLAQGAANPDERPYEFTLGPTGARGRVVASRLSTRDAREIVVAAVEAGSAADGALKVGDVVVGVDGRPFAEDARVVFGRAIGAAEAAADGSLRLTVRRDGAETAVTLKLARLGAYADTAPFSCEKSARVLDAACAYLAKRGLGDGVQGHVNALALLAAGRPEDAEIVRAYARKIAPKDLKLSADDGLPAWEWGYAATFLGEYFLATGDAEVVPALTLYARTMARGQSPGGFTLSCGRNGVSAGS